MSDANPNRDEVTPNPYGPSASTSTRYAEGEIQLPSNQQRGMIGQIPIVGVLMIVQGILLGLLSVAVMFYAILMPQFFEEMQRDIAAQGGNATPMPPEFGSYFMIVGVIVGLVFGAIGVLTIVAGWKVIRFRGRTLAIVMLCTGMVSIITCYCFPSALALAVYGLVVLLSGPVKLAFDLAERGYDPQEIQKAFLMLPGNKT